jgi:predicted membrane chloride channel (bestrophin family)
VERSKFNHMLLVSHSPANSTNSSYGRWDEARKMWGQVVNRSRDIARQVGTKHFGARLLGSFAKRLMMGAELAWWLARSKVAG